MNKLDFFGVGPKIGRIFIPWLALTIVLSCISNRFNFYAERNSALTISGAGLLVFGLIFYFSSVRLLLSGLKEGKLVTSWTSAYAKIRCICRLSGSSLRQLLCCLIHG